MTELMVQATTLTGLPGVRHGFFTRQGGVSEGIYASLNGGIGSNDVQEHVTENRARMAGALGVQPAHLLSCYQIHSPQVIVADTSWAHADRPRADAIVTKIPGLAACVSTADCGPVLFAEPEAGVVGAAHAGWRGALGGVVEATLAAMDKLGAKREHIVVALGPMIRQPNYEVSNDLIDKFRAEDADSERFFVPGARAGHAQFDLPGYIASRLARAGITRVEDIGHCTYADPARFYSYRRTTHRGEADYGRHVNAIALAA